MKRQTTDKTHAAPQHAIRILLADDHAVVREALRSLLERQPDMEVVGDVGDGRTAVKLAQKLRPDIVVMDIGMPDLNGIDAARQTASSITKVLCLSVHGEKGLISSMLQAGASGYVSKTDAARDLVEAVRVVAAGGVYLSPPVAAKVVQDYVGKKGDPHAGPFARLTGREREVLQLITEGHHTKEIAGRLNISVKTVFVHRDNMMKKLGVTSNVDLAKYALREGISEL